MAKGFKQNSRAYFQFLKGNPGCPKDRGPWRGSTRDRKVFQNLAQSAESFDSGLLIAAGKMERSQHTWETHERMNCWAARQTGRGGGRSGHPGKGWLRCRIQGSRFRGVWILKSATGHGTFKVYGSHSTGGGVDTQIFESSWGEKSSIRTSSMEG